MLKTVLCEKDTLREDMCFECRKKSSLGEFNELDVKVSQSLGRISKNFPITNVAFHKAVDVDEFLVLICSGAIGALIGSKGRVVAELSKQFGKKVRIIEKTKNERKAIQDIVGNVRIIGVKKTFNPGSFEITVLIQKEDEGKLSASKETLSKSLNVILGAKTTLEFR